MFKCKTCDHTIIFKPERGSLMLEIVLWLLFAFVFLPIPLFYSLWKRLGSKVFCQNCKQHTLYIPANSVNKKPLVGSVDLKTEETGYAKLTNFSVKKEKTLNKALSIILKALAAVLILWFVIIIMVVVTGKQPKSYVDPGNDKTKSTKVAMVI